MNKLTYDEMDGDTKARWIALLSAIEVVERYCNENGKSFDDTELRIPAIKHYMNETLSQIKVAQLEDNEEENNIKNIDSIKARLTRNFLHNIIDINVPRKRSYAV